MSLYQSLLSVVEIFTNPLTEIAADFVKSAVREELPQSIQRKLKPKPVANPPSSSSFQDFMKCKKGRSALMESPSMIIHKDPSEIRLDLFRRSHFFSKIPSTRISLLDVPLLMSKYRRPQKERMPQSSLICFPASMKPCFLKWAKTFQEGSSNA